MIGTEGITGHLSAGADRHSQAGCRFQWMSIRGEFPITDQ